MGAWLKGGWHVTVAYARGFAVMLAVLGFHGHGIKAGQDKAQSPEPVPRPTR